MLEAVEVSKKYWDRSSGRQYDVLQSCSLQIAAGEAVGLMGPSGCGKSTLARVLLRLLPTDSGRIIFQTQDVTQLSQKQLKPFRQQVQFISQRPESFFDPLLQTAMMERNAMEYDLKDAVLNLSQFTLYHQPQVTSEGRIVGTEALLRWNHPHRGLVMPGDFIPMAEGNGMIVVIGDWVLQMACAQLAVWAQNPHLAHLSIAVNVSARQFCELNFVQSVTEMVRQYDVAPGKLKIELTESQLTANVDEIIGKMNELKKIGITFSLDDFGTGYSSLAFLKRLPLDQVKIDKSFVMDLLDDPNDAAIAGTIMTLASSLGLEAIAEGVETKEQMEFLQNLGCHMFQGYLFSPPQPVEVFESYALAAGQNMLQDLFASPPHVTGN